MYKDYSVYSKLARLEDSPPGASVFLGKDEYERFLANRIHEVLPEDLRGYAIESFRFWGSAFESERLTDVGAEILFSLASAPHYLYIGDRAGLGLIQRTLQKFRFTEGEHFVAFLVEDALLENVGRSWFTPYAVYPLSLAQSLPDAPALVLSGPAPPTLYHPVLNQYRREYIDLARFRGVLELSRRGEGKTTVLYADYRKSQTMTAISQYLRGGEYLTVALVDDGSVCNSGYDAIVPEPFFYLWPLLLQLVDPDVVHLNAGAATGGIPFAPFIPRERTVVDFYDILGLVPDFALKEHHEPLHICRSAESFLCNYDYVMHKCSPYVSEELKKLHGSKAEIVSVLEYVKEPTFSSPSPEREIVRLAYGGLLLQTADVSDNQYKVFMDMVEYYCHPDVHLYIYPSPYLYGFRKSAVIEQLITRHGLSSVHNCMPLAEDAFVEEISHLDFGVFGLSQAGSRPQHSGYILSFKFIAYLRAGLPVLVPEDYTLHADLVREHGLGVVFGYDDPAAIPALLKGQDINRLKENVRKFRAEFGIDRGGDKVRALYQRITKKTSLKGTQL